MSAFTYHPSIAERFTVEGHHAGAAADVPAAVADLASLLVAFARPTAIASGIVDASATTFAGLGDRR
jgi:hypothetical protein